MAAAAPQSAQLPVEMGFSNHAVEQASVKALSESSGLTSIPSDYAVSTLPNASSASDPDSLPTIDFSLLTSTDPNLRSQAIQHLGKACQEWGFFLLVNHGVPERLMKAVTDGCNEFFNLPLEEKMELATRDVWEPLRFGTGVDIKVEKTFLWRDFLKAFVHPEFHFPAKPQGFSEVAREYCQKTREVLLELLKGVSKSLGLEEDYIEKTMNLDSGFQLFAANLYPICPQPEVAMGIPAHTDHGLLTLLIQNGVGGLQIEHNGKWFNANPPPNSIVVNTADQLEVVSNGKYKSIKHRAVVNNQATRISIAMANGPSLDTVVGPAQEILAREGCAPAFMPMKFKDYMDLMHGKVVIDGKLPLDTLRLPN